MIAAGRRENEMLRCGQGEKMSKPRLRRYMKLLLSEPPLRLATTTALKVAQRFLPRSPKIFEWAADFDALSYTAYGVGLLVAAQYAEREGSPGFTAVEFGVAGGNGLLALSKYAELASRLTGLKIQVVGFDAGGGLPESEDPRDAPWHWNAGDFPCNLTTLRERLPIDADVIIGRIEDTLPSWLRNGTRLPIGFVSVDVDYYSSTKAICTALRDAPTTSILPLIECYFDDYLHAFVPRRVGGAAALSEFNSISSQRFFDRDDWLSEGRPYAERLWLRRMHTFYSLDHPSMQSRKARGPERLDLVAS